MSIRRLSALLLSASLTLVSNAAHAAYCALDWKQGNYSVEASLAPLGMAPYGSCNVNCTDPKSNAVATYTVWKQTLVGQQYAAVGKDFCQSQLSRYEMEYATRAMAQPPVAPVMKPQASTATTTANEVGVGAILGAAGDLLPPPAPIPPSPGGL